MTNQQLINKIFGKVKESQVTYSCDCTDYIDDKDDAPDYCSDCGQYPAEL